MRSERNLAYPAGAQEGRHLRFPPSCESPLSLRKHGEIFRTETIKERQRIFSTVGADQCVRPFLYLYAMPDSLLLHISATLRRRGTRWIARRAREGPLGDDCAAQLVCLMATDSTYELQLLTNFTVGCGKVNCPKGKRRSSGGCSHRATRSSGVADDTCELHLSFNSYLLTPNSCLA